MCSIIVLLLFYANNQLYRTKFLTWCLYLEFWNRLSGCSIVKNTDVISGI